MTDMYTCIRFLRLGGTMVNDTSPTPHDNTVLLLAPLILWVMGVYLFLPTDPDFWWHLKMGEIILDTGAIPRSDIFSSLSFGRPMVAHEWLSEVVFASIYRLFGYAGLTVIWGMLAALSLYVVYRTCRIRGLDALPAVIASALATRLTLLGAGVRPQIFTVVGTSLVVWVLTRVTREGWSRWMSGVPVLFCLWANAHGGYILGIGLLWLTCVVAWFSCERSLVRKLGMLTVVCTMASLVTPHGASVWLYPFQYANLGSASLRYILEWQSPNFHDSTTVVMLVIVLAMAVVGVRQKPSSSIDVAWAVLFTAMGLLSNRHIPLFAIVVTPIVCARVLHEFPSVRRWLAEFDLRIVGIALVVVIPLVTGLRLTWRSTMDMPLQLGGKPAERNLPSSAVRQMLERLPPGALLNEYDWGGYLIYHLYPTWRIGVDGRADVHGDAMMDLNYQIFNGATGWQEEVERLKVVYLLVRKGGPLAIALNADPSWSLVVDGNVERLFARRDTRGSSPH